MAKKSIFKRGFKANAERMAKQYREELSIHPCAPLCAFKLASHLNIPVYNATEFLNSPEDLKLLSNNCEWSALTMTTKSNNRIIIHNEFHSEMRQQSNIMHELAHIICDHQHNQVEYAFDIPFGMREFNELQEEEAKYLGATLQLATPGLLWANKRNMTHEEISQHFNASQEMVTYRLNVTGINRRRYA
ncbi:ImmA/IrrE family metallo-endopeptidase [Sphingobacterium hungaricum]|uniref:IrrE N-terminal-like domain-containing protein n=1 Tax=Sphingobacterium hungaricum TaxID=2082723 RepID=A0A928UZS5_9SPHI|nr:ImmA/IrrE family metallo-endopeptidase [Sphingobacterium hungaricum]MBE8715098.1 hypothetical protein [Sphingobacterium hungaricum]